MRHGVELDRYRRAGAGNRILTVGRLVAKKGLDVLVRARVSAAVRDGSVRLADVGKLLVPGAEIAYGAVNEDYGCTIACFLVRERGPGNVDGPGVCECAGHQKPIFTDRPRCVKQDAWARGGWTR